MSGADNSDVERAMAALGAPAMPYRSFAPAPATVAPASGTDQDGASAVEFPLLMDALPEAALSPPPPASETAETSHPTPVVPPQILPTEPGPLAAPTDATPMHHPVSPRQEAPPFPPATDRPSQGFGASAFAGRPSADPYRSAPPPPARFADRHATDHRAGIGLFRNPPPVSPPAPSGWSDRHVPSGGSLSLSTVFRVLRGTAAEPPRENPPRGGLQDLLRCL